jgi:Ca-activated chloride channel family protein
MCPQFLPFVFCVSLILLVFYVWSEALYGRASEKFAARAVLKKIAPSYSRKRRAIRIIFNMAAVFLIGVALARPQWGFYWKEKRAAGLDILIALDVSKSMLAADLPPDRLGYAKKEIMDFVRNLDGDRVGLIAFAGDAFLYCPLTMDYKGFFLTLNGINTQSIAKGGTSFYSAVEESARSFKWAVSADKTLIIMGDGQDTTDSLDSAVKKAKEEGICIFSVGLGTGKGDLIPYIDDKDNRQILKDRTGKPVRAALDEASLKKISSQTGGVYALSTPSSPGLKAVYDKGLVKVKKREASVMMARSYKERFQIFLALALIALISEITISMVNKDERR